MLNEQRIKSEQRQQNWVDLQRWYRSPLGKLFGETEAKLLKNSILPLLFGYHIVAVGMPEQREVLTASPILQRYCLDMVSASTGANLDLLADPAALPIASDCIDAVLLPHVLEFAADPHAVLREIDRVLIPEGHVVILGFNPVSLWGLWRVLRARSGQAPWSGRFFSVNRLRDWLSVLGFEIVAVHYRYYLPPLKNPVLLDKLAFLEQRGDRWWRGSGGGYVLLAKKRVSTLTPIKPRWRSRRRLIAEGVANHSLRNHRRG